MQTIRPEWLSPDEFPFTVRRFAVAGGIHFPMADDPDLFAVSVRDWYASRVMSGPTRPDGT